MTNKDVHEALIKWIASLTGLLVIKTNQSGERPEKPYITVNMTAVASVRVHPTDYGIDDGEAATISPLMVTEWRFQVQAYGDEPSDILRQLKSAQWLRQITEPLEPLVIHEMGRINDVPEWINEAWEPRANMDLFLHGTTRDGFVVDLIETVPTFDLERTS